jgi:hypothetical protein
VSRAAHAWLEQWRAAIPPTLVAVIERALSEAGDAHNRSDALCDAAVACLRTAWRISDERAAAVHLLAADALITAALEIAAEDPRALAELGARFSAHEVYTLFREELSSKPS